MYILHYLYKVKVDVEVVSFVWIESQISERKISVVPSYHKIFWVVDEKSELERKTQFKYQTIFAPERPNAEGEIVCEDGPCVGSWVVFPPQIGQIHKRHLLEVSQKNIIENIPLAVSFIVNANLTVIPLKAGFQVFLSISVISSPSSSRLWISSIDSDGRSSDLAPAVPQGLHHHHLLGKVTID